MKDYESQKRQLWIDTYTAYVTSSNSIKKEAGIIWADYVVKEFEQRFKD